MNNTRSSQEALAAGQFRHDHAEPVDDSAEVEHFNLEVAKLLDGSDSTYAPFIGYREPGLPSAYVEGYAGRLGEALADMDNQEELAIQALLAVRRKDFAKALELVDRLEPIILGCAWSFLAQALERRRAQGDA